MVLDPALFRRAEELFAAALSLAPPERADFIATSVKGQPELLDLLEQLLRVHDTAGSFLEPPAAVGQFRRQAADAVSPREATLEIGHQIGDFRVLGLLGQGGMGVVYRASQTHPRREVALKVLRPGFVSASLVRRFEHEVALLGRLQHPGIAQVFEAGTFERGHGPEPWFAMELVEGTPLNAYAEERGLGVRERLRLIERICRSVQHAHVKGVIHRDLKPGNILVDRTGEPRILDFGVARSTGSDVALTTVHSEVATIVGTLPYMSPEQVNGRADEIDTRSDIYSLGVITYELLTGRLPFEVRGRSLIEAAQVITTGTVPSLGATSRSLRGDIEVIVGRAMDREPARRYASAAEFGADLDRFLNHQPIVARPPSALYQFRKLVARHRGVAAAVGALLFTVTGFAVAMSFLYADARHQTHRAEAANEFLGQMLTGAQPEKSNAREMTVAELLDRSAVTVGVSFRDEPLVEANLRGMIGNGYRYLGLHEAADSHLVRALALLDRPPTRGKAAWATMLDDLGGLRLEQNRLSEADSLKRMALTARSRLFRRPNDDLARSFNNLGFLATEQGHYAEAESLLTMAREDVVRLHPGPTQEKASVLTNYGILQQELGHDASAESLLTESLATQRALYRGNNANITVALNNLGLHFHQRGDRARAEPYYRASIEMGRTVFGEGNPRQSMAMGNLAALLVEEKRFADAEPLYREVLAIERAANPKSWTVGLYLGNLGESIAAQGHPAEALTMIEEALAIMERELGPDHLRSGLCRCKRGDVLLQEELFAESEAELLRGIGIVVAAVGPNHPRLARCRDSLRRLYERTGRGDEARKYREPGADSTTSKP